MAQTPGGFTANALLCDSAEEVNGKLYILGGGWNMLNAKSFPHQQPRLSIAGVIAVPYHLTNMNHMLDIMMASEDAPVVPTTESGDDDQPKPMMHIQAQFNIGRPAALRHGDSQHLPLAFNIDQMVFTNPGGYAVVISVDGQEIERISFVVQSAVGVSAA